ncbi:MAG TPA: hypothetical protein QGG47_10155 [Acidobacteriota bacterium]|nr:hypothetical protein [Acidobacteriota bacterium]
MDWSRGAASLCREFGISDDSFYRHVNYYGLHDERVNAILTFCSIGISKALRSGNVRLSDAAALGNLAMKFMQGGEVVKLQVIGEMEQELFPRVLDAMRDAGVTNEQIRRVARTLVDQDGAEPALRAASSTADLRRGRRSSARP